MGEQNDVELIELKELVDEKQRVLVVERREKDRVELGYGRRESDRLPSLYKDSQEIIQKIRYPEYNTNEYVMIVRYNYPDAERFAREEEYDFGVMYRLRDDDVLSFLKKVPALAASWSGYPINIVAYRSRDTMGVDVSGCDIFLPADTCFERYSKIKNREDCRSEIERRIWDIWRLSLTEQGRGIILCGELHEKKIVGLIKKVSEAKQTYLKLRGLVYEANQFYDAEWVQEQQRPLWPFQRMVK